MNKKNKLILFIVTGIVVLLVGLGVSYSYFATKYSGRSSASNLTGLAADLQLIYTDGNATIEGENIIPGWSASKTFTIENTGSITAGYQFKVVNVYNDFYYEDSISFEITPTNTPSNGEETVPDQNLYYENGIVSDTIEIEPNTTHYYTLTVHYNDLDDANQLDELGATFYFQLTIEPVNLEYAEPPEPPVLNPSIKNQRYFDAQSGTLLYAIRTTNNITGTATTPGKEGATEDESVLASALDDYGTSYYFRGIPDNNFVKFANMCWRIVRIVGDGSVKLVLYNYNPNSVSNPCVSSEDAASRSYIGLSTYNNSYTRNTYVGYMYSNSPSSTVYNISHANNTDSNILATLKTWYDQKLRSYNSKLADVIWCNDVSVVSDTTYNPNSLSSIAGTGVNADVTYYSSSYRINPANNAVPSLVCPNAGTDGKLSKFTASDTANGNGKLRGTNGTGDDEYKIGLLTIDEVSLAGGVYNSSGISYLAKNTLNDRIYTMSPCYFNNAYATVWQYRGNDSNEVSILCSQVNIPYDRARPAIALKYDTTISGGVGTQANPFVVN